MKLIKCNLEIEKKKVLEAREQFCFGCMQEHVVETVEITEKTYELGKENLSFLFAYPVECFYCSNTDTYFEDEDMIKKNQESMEAVVASVLGSAQHTQLTD